MPRVAIPSLVLLACAVASTLLVSGLGGRANSVEAVGPSAPNQMALDADPNAPGVQASRTVSDSALFNVGIDVTKVGATPYYSYQWEFEYPTNAIYFSGAVTHNTGGTGIVGCYTPTSGPGVLSPADTSVSGACTGGPPTSYTGLVESFQLGCLSTGVFTIHLLDVSQDPFGSTLEASSAELLDTGTTSMTINCTNGGTVVPTATNTPSNLPTPTATPTRAAAPNVMALDADDDSPGVQATRTVFGSSPFTMAIWVTSLGQTPYAGYQWEFAFPDALKFDDAVIEHSLDTGMPACSPLSIVSGVLQSGDTDVQHGCLRPGADTHIFYTGRTTSFAMSCLKLGTYTVTLVSLAQDPNFGSALVSYQGDNLATTTENATITCAPPAAATATHVEAPVSVGGVADVYVGGNPRSGAADAGSGQATEWAMAISLATVAALSMGGGAWYLKRRSRR